MNIFFIRKPRIPEMHVYIHESRRRDEPFACLLYTSIVTSIQLNLAVVDIRDLGADFI